MPGQPRIKLFYKIGEVSRLADVEPYILRYWETEFPMLCPRKNQGGQRVYQPRDLEMVLSIKRMLHDEGYTIAGARKKLSERAPAKKENEKVQDAARDKALKAPPGTQLSLVVLDDSGWPKKPGRGSGPAMKERKEEDKRLASALGRFKAELLEIIDLIK